MLLLCRCINCCNKATQSILVAAHCSAKAAAANWCGPLHCLQDWDTAFPDKRIAAIAEEVVKTAEAAASAPAAPAAAPTGAGRRLLRHQAVDPSSHQNATARHRRLAAAAQIPVITGGADDAGAGPLPTQLPPQTLEDMLCAIAPFAGKAVDTSKCKPQPKGMYSHAGLSFKPVTVPVVFHCECRSGDQKHEVSSDLVHLIDCTAKATQVGSSQVSLVAIHQCRQAV